MTEGYGVEDNQTIPARMQIYLNKFDILNGGVASYSPMLEYLYLTTKGILINPKIVFLFFDLSDIQDDYFYEQQAKFDSEGNLIAIPSLDTDIGKSIFRRIESYLYSNSALALLAGRAINKITGSYSSKPDMVIGDINSDRWFVTRCEDEVNLSYIKKHLNRSLYYILKMKEFSSKNNISFILVTYPYGHQISGDEWFIGRQSVAFNQRATYCTHSLDMTEEFARLNNISLISLTEDIKKIKQKEGTTFYHRIDMHFNRIGYDRVARLVAEKFVEVYNNNGKQ